MDFCFCRLFKPVAFFCSAVRCFYEQGVRKMLKIFPLSDKMLQLVPAADPAHKEEFSAHQIQTLAKKLNIHTDPEALDGVHTEWIQHQFDDDSPPSSGDVVSFWHQAASIYPNLSVVMKALLCVPHSNAQSERAFSMLKKVFTDQRADLCKETVNALMSVKMNTDVCCHKTSLDSTMQQKLKRAAFTYNEKHGSYTTTD